MSYQHIAKTASARKYLTESEQAQELARRPSTYGQREMECGLTCQQWLDIYLKRTPVASTVCNVEATHDDENRREVEGPQASGISAAEGMGDTASQEAVSEAPGRSINQTVAADPGGQGDPSWLDEAYPAGNSRIGEFDTPF